MVHPSNNRRSSSSTITPFCIMDVFRRVGYVPVSVLALLLFLNMNSNINLMEDSKLLPHQQLGNGNNGSVLLSSNTVTRSTIIRDTTSWQGEVQSAISKMRQDRLSRMSSLSCPNETISLVDPQRGIDENSTYFNCHYDMMPNHPTYLCGEYTRWTSPYVWECRLKQRLFGVIEMYDLPNDRFGGLDVGTATGDWVVAVGVKYPNSVFAAIEANPQTFDHMHSNMEVNSNLLHRVTPYHAAAGSNTKYEEHQRSFEMNGTRMYDTQNGWTGPFICIKTEDISGMAQVKANRQCTTGEAEVPVLTIDDMVLNWDIPGRLLFVKIDIEGSELEALLGANRTLSLPEIRPCIIYIELKHKIDRRRDFVSHKLAFNLLLELGYTEVEDVDSGRVGPDSYPPLGVVWKNEGNYEFQLKSSEMKQCVERVRKSSQVDT